MTSIGMKTVAPGPARNCERCEIGALKENIGWSRADRAGFTTHHSCHRQCLFLVGDYQHIRSELNILTVQQGELFSRPCVANADTTFEFAEVECVHRLTEFEQYIIGDVNHRVDRTQ